MSAIAKISLRTKIGLLVILGLLGLLSLFAFLGMEALRQSVETTLHERLAITQMIGEHIDRHLEESLRQLEEVATSRAVDLEDGDLEPEEQLLDDTYLHLQGFAQLVLLVGRDGTVLWTEPYHRALIGTTLAGEPHVQKTLQTGRPHASGLVWLDIPEESAPHMAAPVRNADGQVAGLIDVAINVAHPSIGGAIQSIRAGETGYVQILDENGAVIAATRPWQQFKKSGLFGISHDARRGQQSTAHLRGLLSPLSEKTMRNPRDPKSHHSDLFVPMIRDRLARVARYEVAEEGFLKREVIAFTPLDQAPWGLSVEQEEDEALALPQRLQKKLLLTGAISLFVAMLLVWITTGRVLGPVEVLTSAAQRIAAGDLTTAVPPTGEGEIAVLADSLEAMRGKLRASHEEIERWAGELEDKVEHRTRELSILLRITRILASTGGLDEVLDSVVTQVIALLEPADAGVLYLYEESLERLVVHSAFGFDLKYLSRMELEPGESIAGQVFSSAEAILFATPEETAAGMKTLRSENLACLQRATMGSRQAQSAICAPLTSRNRIVGSFLLLSYWPARHFAESDLRLLDAIADQIAIAIENARLLKQADEARALQEADRLKSEFISTISHELRTPLASIKGYATTLLREDARWDQTTQREFLEVIDEESDKLRGLIDNLLERSRMEAGVLDIEKQPVRIAPIGQQSVEKFTSRTDRHVFTVSFPDCFPVVEADPRRLEQVLDNLIENAMKYSPDGGQIAIRGAVVNGEAVVSVSDEGVGIPSEHLDRVFDRFYQVNTPLTRRSNGSGLGLSIARWLVEAHGGRIWAESTPGRGSTFFFTLPLL